MTSPPSRLASLLKFLQLDPGNLTLCLDASREAFAVSDWETARRLLDAGLRAHPAHAELQEMSGFAHLQAHRYAESEKALRAARDAGAQSAGLDYHLALAIFMQGRYADTLEQLGSQPSLPGEPSSAVLRARCLHHLRRPAEAIALLEEHLVAAPEDAEAHGLLGLLLAEEERGGAARVHIDAALQRNTGQIEALLALASLQSAAGESGPARESFDAIVSLDPNCGRAWLGRALLNLRDMRLPDAQRDVQMAATHLPEHLGTWHVLAWVHLILGELDGAQVAFEQAMSVSRTFGETHGGLAIIAALQDREADARQHLTRARRLDPHALSTNYAAMLLLQKEGRHEEAKAVLDAVLSRPAGRQGLQYRELVLAQLQSLGGRVGHRVPGILH